MLAATARPTGVGITRTLAPTITTATTVTSVSASNPLDRRNRLVCFDRADLPWRPVLLNLDLQRSSAVFEGKPTMLTKTVSIISAAALALVATSALAQGHIAGGAVGAMAGAKSHHAVAGAVVGGAVGHHMAKTHAKRMAKKADKKS
jgi:hypothetical protein